MSKDNDDGGIGCLLVLILVVLFTICNKMPNKPQPDPPAQNSALDSKEGRADSE